MIFWYTIGVGYIRDLLTDICLVGAAVSFAAYLTLMHARLIARVSDWIVRVPRSHLAAFLLFAAIATVCAQKQGGTNAPPNGASPPQMVPPSGGNVELRIENVELRNFPSLAEGEQHHNSPFYILHSQLPVQFPTNAVRAENWWRRGGCKCKMENVEWRMCA